MWQCQSFLKCHKEQGSKGGPILYPLGYYSLKLQIAPRRRSRRCTTVVSFLAGLEGATNHCKRSPPGPCTSITSDHRSTVAVHLDRIGRYDGNFQRCSHCSNSSNSSMIKKGETEWNLDMMAARDKTINKPEWRHERARDYQIYVLLNHLDLHIYKEIPD